MTVSTRKDPGAMPQEAPPARSRRGGAAAWILIGVVVVLVIALFGFFLDGGVREAPAALEGSDGVLLDPTEDLGN